MDLVYGRGFPKIVFSILHACVRACVRPTVRPSFRPSRSPKIGRCRLTKSGATSCQQGFGFCDIRKNVAFFEKITTLTGGSLIFLSTLSVTAMRPTKNECTGGPDHPEGWSGHPPDHPSGWSGHPVHSFVMGRIAVTLKVEREIQLPPVKVVIDFAGSKTEDEI